MNNLDKYDSLMNKMGYDEPQITFFKNWELVKDEIVLPERKEGSANGTIHIYLGGENEKFMKTSFPEYYKKYEDHTVNDSDCPQIKHFVKVSNLLSLCSHTYLKLSEKGTNDFNIIEYINKVKSLGNVLEFNSLFKFSPSSGQDRPYFKQFSGDAFNTYIRKLLIPKFTAYNIRFYKDSKSGNYACFWILGQTNLDDIQLDTEVLPKLLSFSQISPLQKIYFGSPGTGKSRALKSFVKENNLEIIRTTFHPDTDYHSFVGGYKPVMEDDKIVYKFVPQAFTKAYTLALQNPDRGFMLAIEEINRGNCASIFGDIFQCLDRTPDGYSTYESEADAELGKYLESLGLGNKIILPPNLLIYATMNTSDQSLFPMDAAFKRRWEWEYVPIDIEDAAQISVRIDDKTSFLWSDFIGEINEKIYEATKSDDKKLGNRFVNPKDENSTLIISKEQFVNKVMFYLWTEIYKDEHESGNTIFKTDDDTKFSYNELFKKVGEFDLALLTNFLKYNGIVQ